MYEKVHMGYVPPHVNKNVIEPIVDITKNLKSAYASSSEVDAIHSSRSKIFKFLSLRHNAIKQMLSNK
jgi:hypothetical protein